ncbi:MAG TPA: glycosyltransferase family 4 protein [Gemmatimonadaceae bacterium]|nr:glycosyltransferase family 4 protein [Gemmatimonadaceae bacterium]
MNHIFVTQDYAPDRGGMARRHVELCRRFAPDEMVVSTVAAAGADAFDRDEPYAIARQRFPFSRANRFTNQLRWARWLVRRVRADRTDLLHCGNVRPAGYAVWWTHRRTGVPYVVYVYGGDLLRELRKTARSRLKRASARRIFGDAAAVIAISPWSKGVAERLLAQLGLAGRVPVVTFDLGTDPAHFHPSRDTGALRRRLELGDAPLLLTVARLVRHKGQDVAIRALARLASDFPTLRYLVVGDGADEPRLRALAAELGVEDRVVFTGPLSDDEIAEAYATASVYVGLSRVDNGINVEGFGISFVEAGASGTPSVAGDSGGVSAAVRDGETGFLVPPEDDAAAAAAIRSLLADPARRAAMGAAARRAVEEHYNWDRVAHETRDFAHALLSRGGVPAIGAPAVGASA